MDTPMESSVVATPSKDDCNLAMLAHLLGIVTGFLGALIIWLIKKDESAFVGESAKEALNFQITMTLAFIVASVLMAVFIGFLLVPLLLLANLVLCILAAMAASKGQAYRYPATLRLLK